MPRFNPFNRKNSSPDTGSTNKTIGVSEVAKRLNDAGVDFSLQTWKEITEDPSKLEEIAPKSDDSAERAAIVKELEAQLAKVQAERERLESLMKQIQEGLLKCNEEEKKINEKLKEWQKPDPQEKENKIGLWEKTKNLGRKGKVRIMGAFAVGLTLVGATAFAFGAGESANSYGPEDTSSQTTATATPNALSNEESTNTDLQDALQNLTRGQEGETSTNNEADTVRGYNRDEDPFFAEGKTAQYNMSNGFDVNGAPEQARTGWLDDVLRSPEMMSMVMAEAGLNDNPSELDDLLTNSPVRFEQHRELVRQLIENATDVHYETLPAGTVYNTWYTALDENGDPQLVQSEGISHDHGVTLLVMDVQVNGQEVTLKINSECGQGISAQMYDNVPVLIPDTNTPDQPTTPGDNTPPTPTTPPTTPGEGTPPTTPQDNPGGETPGVEPKSDDPNTYAQAGADSGTDSGEGKKPLSQADSEAQDSARVQPETSEGDSSSNQPGSGTNTNAPGTNGNTVDTNGSVGGGGDGQANTGTVTGP